VSRYRLSPEARDDLRDIRQYLINEAGLGVARRVMRDIATALELLSARPGLGHVRQELTDEPVKFWQVFSYLLIYDPVSRLIGVVRVLHSARDIPAILLG
jgi:plasmid stabilization system protein ParE